MVKIAYILLCHKDPDAIIRQADRLTAAGDCLAIHFDARASNAEYARLNSILGGNPRVALVRNRVKCGWGEWSLVQATLNAAQTALAAFPDATHFYMISGDCMPIKSAAHTHDHLARSNMDHIESVDFHDSGWIKTGIREERLTYRHHFNERTQPRRFYFAMALQKRLGLRRAIPKDLRMMIGSQWWCLRRATVRAILDFCRTRRDVVRFFRTTWIPDETFFQTLVRHLVPRAEIESRSPTFLLFSDYGMPVTFYDDHFDMLVSQDALFARKISPDADRLRCRLGALYAEENRTFQMSGEGRALHAYLTQLGREGRRFAPRFWETGGTLGPDSEMLIILCKKWHVAKRLARRIEEHAGLPAIHYLFNEEDCVLPDLGGIEASMVKRHRHRRALMQMLFACFDTKTLVICLDPADRDLLADFFSDRCITRVLEVACRFSDGYLAGHAHRVGLAGPATPQHNQERLLPTLRNDIAHEMDIIRRTYARHHSRISEGGCVMENAAALAGFLSVPCETARAIVASGELFSD